MWNDQTFLKKYNKSMGGVDNMDKLINYYRSFIKSLKWTLRGFPYF